MTPNPPANAMPAPPVRVSVDDWVDGAEVLRLGQQGAQVADLADVRHLMSRDQLAHLEQGRFPPARVRDRALPLALAPTMQQVHCAAPDASEVRERFVQRTVQ